MFVTLAVFHEPMLTLNVVALWNICHMFDTDATFHLLMSALNVGLPENKSYMLLTALVSQSAMLPYVAAAVVGLVTHAVAAVPMFAFVMAVCACAEGVKVQLKMSTAPMSRRRLTQHGNVHFDGRTWKEPESSKARRTYILVHMCFPAIHVSNFEPTCCKAPLRRSNAMLRASEALTGDGR
jgi:uncharacterized membrane protein YuzA (DUF378 family)